MIITFMIVFLSPNYVNNPFLKAKFMSVSRRTLMIFRPKLTCLARSDAFNRCPAVGLLPEGHLL